MQNKNPTTATTTPCKGIGCAILEKEALVLWRYSRCRLPLAVQWSTIELKKHLLQRKLVSACFCFAFFLFVIS